MTGKIDDVEARDEILDRIINYAQSAKRTLAKDKDPGFTIGYLKSQVRRLEELNKR